MKDGRQPTRCEMTRVCYANAGFAPGTDSRIMKLFVTGACGYKGTVLVPKLLAAGHEVLAFDIMWFGNYLRPHSGLTVVQGDVRDVDEIHLEGADAIVHLASVANDPCGDLDPKLTWEIGCLATMQLADKAARAGVRRFLYASSGSVYGVKDEPQVTEDLTLDPISEYNKTKMVAERVAEHAPARITVTESNDPRSYRINSDRLLATGFRPKKTVDDAIRELVHRFRRGELRDEERFHNLEWMRREVVN